MLRTEYDTARAKLRDEKSGALEASLEVNGRLRRLGEQQLAALQANGAVEDYDAKRTALETERDEIQTRRDDIDRALEGLEAKEAEGFDFVRPKGWFNRFLPPIPNGVKEVKDTGVIRLGRFSSALLAGCITLAALFLVTLPQLASWTLTTGPLYLATLGSEPSQTMSDKELGFFGAYGIGVSVALVLFATVTQTLTHRAVFNRQLRFFHGAAEWTFRQKLRACVAYGLSGTWVMFCPLLLVPVAIGLGAVRMAIYVRLLKRHGHSEQAVAAAVQATHAFARSMMVLGGFVCLFGALLLLSA